MGYETIRGYISRAYFPVLDGVKKLVEGIGNTLQPNDGLAYAVADSISYARRSGDSRTFEFIPPSKPIKKSDEQRNGNGASPRSLREKNQQRRPLIRDSEGRYR